MNQSKFSKQSICGDPRCSGPSCDTCEAIRISVDEQDRIQCPNGVPSCEDGKMCDKCATKLYPKHEQSQQRGGGAVDSRSAPDVVPHQDFEVEQSGPICQGCRKLEGSNDCCPICVFFKESAKTAQNDGDQNPNVPVSIQFQKDVGPRPEDLCALTEEVVKASVYLLDCVFLSMVLPRIPITSFIPDSQVGQWRGCQWSNGNCWLVVILQMFQTGGWHTSINVSNPLGNALWILVHELRTTWFVPRQKLQAFRRLMAEIIGQYERGTLFENGQMDPFDVLNMLEKAGAFRYYYRLYWTEKVEGIHATPVVDLGLSPSSSRNLIEKIDMLNIDIQFDRNSDFSNLRVVVIKVSESERNSGSTVDFPNYAKFDICHLSFQIVSVLLFINRQHYLTVFISLRYDPKTDTIYTTYRLSDSKSNVQDCGHHVPSIVEIDQAQFEYLWKHHAISIMCVRIPNVVQIDGIPHESNGLYFKPLIPACESLPQCDEGQYTTFGPNREILIKQCMSPLKFKPTFSPPPPAPCAQVSQLELTSVVQKPIVVEKLTFADITISRDGEWSIRRNSFFKKGTCVVCQDKYMYGNAVYSQAQLILLLNILYQH